MKGRWIVPQETKRIIELGDINALLALRPSDLGHFGCVRAPIVRRDMSNKQTISAQVINPPDYHYSFSQAFDNASDRRDTVEGTVITQDGVATANVYSVPAKSGERVRKLEAALREIVKEGNGDLDQDYDAEEQYESRIDRLVSIARKALKE